MFIQIIFKHNYINICTGRRELFTFFVNWFSTRMLFNIAVLSSIEKSILVGRSGDSRLDTITFIDNIIIIVCVRYFSNDIAPVIISWQRNERYSAGSIRELRIIIIRVYLLYYMGGKMRRDGLLLVLQSKTDFKANAESTKHRRFVYILINV